MTGLFQQNKDYRYLLKKVNFIYKKWDGEKRGDIASIYVMPSLDIADADSTIKCILIR